MKVTAGVGAGGRALSLLPYRPMIRIGPAGWSYRDWKGIVYPAAPPRGFDPLTYLASYFDTIEINSTFYRPVAVKTAHGWIQRVSSSKDFRFTAKLWRRFTHERSTAWTRAELKEVRAGIDVLHESGKLGALLVQFPWSFRRDEAAVTWLTDVFTAFQDLPLVVEVRHASWNDPGYLQELSARNVGFVNIDQPRFRDSIGPSSVATSAVGYIRVHGRNYSNWWKKDSSVEARYDYLYSPAELRPWVTRAVEVEEATEDVYVVTNNHYRGKAVANALMMRSMVEKRRVPAPPDLLQEYRSELKRFTRQVRSGSTDGGASPPTEPERQPNDGGPGDSG